MCGLAGGKGIPADVAERPCTFATLTAPSFGPVHGVRAKGPCRGASGQAALPARPPAVVRQAAHEKATRRSGTPLCWECYDYTGHVLWQWYAPELWRRFTIGLQRELAKTVGLTVEPFRERCRISYSKVVEFQARGPSTCTSRSGSTAPTVPTARHARSTSRPPTSRTPSRPQRRTFRSTPLR